MKDEIALSAQLLKAKQVFKQIQQISWSIKNMEERYPAFAALQEEEVEEMLRFYLALRLDLQQAYEDLETIRKEYEPAKTKRT